MTPQDVIADTAESQIVRWVEAAIGPVERIEREGRWRPCWHVDVRTDEGLAALFVRGDRPGDWPPMPLSYECDVFRLFEACGVRVPHVHGFIEELPGIVMDRMPGAPGLQHAASEADRDTIRRQLVEQMLLIHRSDVAGMEAIGAPRPGNDNEAALTYYRLIENLFTANRAAPAPAVEFVRRWLNRHVPENPDGVCPVTVDAAQFIFEGDRLTAMLDFEFAGIGDYHSDLAALRIRNRAEYIGDIDEMIAFYAKASGTWPDRHRIRFHTAVIAILTPLQVHRELANAPEGIDYHEYLVWNAFCVLIALDCISEMQGYMPEAFALPDHDPPSCQSLSLKALASALGSAGEDEDEFSSYRREKNQRVLRYAEKASRFQPVFDQEYLDDSEMLLGQRPRDWAEADRLLEERVTQENPDDDEALVRVFTRRFLRTCFLLADPSDTTNFEQLTTRMKPLS
jgi:aminoglycoside phosphotransferase (APT) family kinase protein